MEEKLKIIDFSGSKDLSKIGAYLYKIGYFKEEKKLLIYWWFLVFFSIASQLMLYL